MPAYDYKCVNCGAEDVRIGGVDDHTAICLGCDGLMVRTNEDVFGPVFREEEASHAQG